MNFIHRETPLGARTYALPDGIPAPIDSDLEALDQLPGYYAKNLWTGKIKAVRKRPQSLQTFDSEADAQKWLSE